MWRIVAAWRRAGVRTAVRTAVSRLDDWAVEMKHGLRTSGLIPIEELIGDWRGCHDYFPTAYRELRTVIGSLQVGGHDVFVDIGAGKGRALLIAAEYPFRTVIGVEISPDLCAEARRLVERRQAKLACRDIRIIEADAAGWPVPADATVIYLYNPFKRERLRRLFAGIEASLAHSPRALTIVFNNPTHFEPIEADYPWLSRLAVVEREYRWIVYRAGRPGRFEPMPA